MADRHDKTEKATPKRRKKARREGQVAKTPDLTSWLGLLAVTLAAGPLLRFAGKQLASVAGQAQQVLATPTTGGALHVLDHGLLVVVEVASLVGVITIATGILGTIGQIGFLVSTKTITPKFSKLNPWAGVKRLLSPNGAWELGKSLVKLGIIAVVAWQQFNAMLAKAGVGTTTSLSAEVKLTGDTVLSLFRTVAFLGLVFSLADWAYHKHQLAKNLRMSKQEIKDEFKEAEGNPHAKGKIKQRQRQMSRNRMMAAVARADVVVMNPTHFAVAIRYQTAESPAPVVLAKGTDEVALRIRAEAHNQHVAVVEDPPLARALHALCEIDQQIPPSLFVAVARLLAFVYRLPSTGRIYATSHSTPASVLPLTHSGEPAEEKSVLPRLSVLSLESGARGVA